MQIKILSCPFICQASTLFFEICLHCLNVVKVVKVYLNTRVSLFVILVKVLQLCCVLVDQIHCYLGCYLVERRMFPPSLLKLIPLGY